MINSYQNGDVNAFSNSLTSSFNMGSYKASGEQISSSTMKSDNVLPLMLNLKNSKERRQFTTFITKVDSIKHFKLNSHKSHQTS